MSRRASYAVVAIASGFGSVFCWHAFARFLTFHNRTFDLAFYTRMAWGVARFDFWDPIVNAHFAGLHLSWVMFPLGIAGALFGTVPVLLAAQAAAVSAVCWPLARFGARRLGDTGAVAAALCWMLYPNIGHVTSYEFHPGTLATLPLAFALDALDRGERRALGWWTVALVACRADLSLVAVMLGLVAVRRGGELRRSGKWICGLSILYFLVFTMVLLPWHAPARGSLQLHFEKWGDGVASIAATVLTSPLAVARHLLVYERLTYLPLLLAPLAFFPLLGARWLLVALPPLLMNLLSDFPTAVDMDCHYQTLMAPVLVVSALEGLARAGRFRIGRLAWIPLAAASVFFNLALGGMPWSFDYARGEFVADQGTRAARRVVGAIPESVTVQAPDRLLPHLAERTRLNRAPPPEHGAAFLVLDVSHRRRYEHQEDLIRTVEEPVVRDWLARSDHAMVLAEKDLVLLQRGRAPRQGLGGRYFNGTVPVTAGTPITDCLSVLGASLGAGQVCLDFVSPAPCPNDLVIRLGPTPRSRRVDLLFDGLLSPVHLRSGDRVRSCHSLSAEERRAIVADGLYVGALRQSGARPHHADPVSVLVPIKR